MKRDNSVRLLLVALTVITPLGSMGCSKTVSDVTGWGPKSGIYVPSGNVKVHPGMSIRTREEFCYGPINKDDPSSPKAYVGAPASLEINHESATETFAKVGGVLVGGVGAGAGVWYVSKYKPDRTTVNANSSATVNNAPQGDPRGPGPN